MKEVVATNFSNLDNCIKNYFKQYPKAGYNTQMIKCWKINDFLVAIRFDRMESCE